MPLWQGSGDHAECESSIGSWSVIKSQTKNLTDGDRETQESMSPTGPVLVREHERHRRGKFDGPFFFCRF